MTDHDEREALIAEARDVAEILEEYAFEDSASKAPGLLNSLADALEASRPSPATVEAVEGFIAGFECDWRDVVPGELAAALVARFTFPAPVVTEGVVERGHREAIDEVEVEAQRIYTDGLWEKLPPTAKANYRLVAASRLSAALTPEAG